MKTTVLILTVMLGLSSFASAQSTVLDGVYTGAQAARGEDAYRTHCVGCHEGNEPDGPLLTGIDFVDRWREDRLGSLFTHIRTEMPGNQPGSLSESTYVEILAFLLEANGLPAGSTPLTAAATTSIQFVGKDGPRPLPNTAAVLLVGCLAAGPNSTWILASSTDPVRTRKLEETTPQELKESGEKPLRSLTFRLQNAPDSTAAWSGHKVQAKGVLIRQTNNDRINVTSLETLAASCAP
jgi:mono/diheme cytochrome c family protein